MTFFRAFLISTAIIFPSFIASPIAANELPELDLLSPTITEGDSELECTPNWQEENLADENATNGEIIEPIPAIETSNLSQAETGWQFFITPASTLPMSAYGTVRIRGINADFHLSTADILERLTAYAGGRFEAWHGSWGIILDGFYYNIKGASGVQRNDFLALASFNPVSYLLNTDITNRLDGINSILADQSSFLQQKKQGVSEDLSRIQGEFEQVRQAAPDRETLMAAIASASAQIEALQALNESIDRETIPVWVTKINELKQILATDQISEEKIQQKLGELQVALASIQGFQEKDMGSIDRLENRVQEQAGDMRAWTSQLRNLQDQAREKIEALPLEGIDRRDLAKIILGGLDEVQGIGEPSTLESIIAKIETAQDKLETIRTLQSEIQAKIETIRSNEDLAALQEKLTQTREQIDQVKTAIAALEELKNSQLAEIIEVLQAEDTQENLAELKTVLETLQAVKNDSDFSAILADLATLDQILANEAEVIGAIQDEIFGTIQQNLTIASSTALAFSETTVDLALSYHFGAPRNGRQVSPPPGEDPIGQEYNYPQWWFEPYVGARLMNLDIGLDQTTNYRYESSLVSLEGQFQINESASRTWISPLLGGKFGVQMNDGLTLWIRGDVSGFDLSGETDWNWNVIFGLEYYVRESIALQLGYGFYSLKYGLGNRPDGFDFSLNYNGPYIGLTLQL